MASALARAYAGNPDLNQQRAGVRATDENLPRASSAWRPKASATGQYGYNYIDLTAPALTPVRAATDPGTLSLTVSQNLFNGNRTLNGVRQAESNIFGARESLRDAEQNVLLNGATAYMNVLRDTAILDLRKNNVIVLEEQLRQTRDRFIADLVTGTDVAQAESSLASARSVLRAELHDRRLARLLMNAGLQPPSDEYRPLDLGRAPPATSLTLWDQIRQGLQEAGTDRSVSSVRRIDAKLEMINPFGGSIFRR